MSPSPDGDPNLYLTIQTAAHVVFGEEEVKHTTVEFFFYSDDDKTGVVAAKGYSHVYTFAFCDLTIFTVKLTKLHEIYSVLNKLKKYNTIHKKIPKGISGLTFAVHHPHGVAKRITFGDTEVVETTDDFFYKFYKPQFTLLCHAHRNVGIRVKKILCFFYYTTFHEEHHSVLKKLYMIKPVPEVRKRKIVKHLLNQCLVDFPTEIEIHLLYDNLRIFVDID